jgi:hypothetical protein
LQELFFSNLGFLTAEATMFKLREKIESNLGSAVLSILFLKMFVSSLV